jgi:hypothetical protein
MEFLRGASAGREVDEEVKVEDGEEIVEGLGMSLQDWVAMNILDPATNGLHSVLGHAVRRIKVPDRKAEPDQISDQIEASLHVNPSLRSRLSNIVDVRKEKITISSLVKDPLDFTKGDDEWDPNSPIDMDDPEPKPVVPQFSTEWAERALLQAASRIDSLADGAFERGEEGVEEEPEEVRRLRFNLLAMARFVPLSEGVELG